MICRKCPKKAHARGMCRGHYMEWYRENGEIASRSPESERYQPKRYWKFTAEHWWKWWEKRTPNAKTLERRSDIEALRRALP